jgi:hypothetical protein
MAEESVVREQLPVNRFQTLAAVVKIAQSAACHRNHYILLKPDVNVFTCMPAFVSFSIASIPFDDVLITPDFIICTRRSLSRISRNGGYIVHRHPQSDMAGWFLSGRDAPK